MIPICCGECMHSYEDLGGLYCSHGVCVDCKVPEDFYCAYAAKKRTNFDVIREMPETVLA